MYVFGSVVQYSKVIYFMYTLYVSVWTVQQGLVQSVV